MRCSAITKGGKRCSRKATDGYDQCYSHRPDTAAERQRNARKGGQTGGRGRPAGEEIEQAKMAARVIFKRLINGEMERATATAASMVLNTWMRGIEVGRKIREQEEILGRVEELEDAARARGWDRQGGRSPRTRSGGNTWGA